MHFPKILFLIFFSVLVISNSIAQDIRVYKEPKFSFDWTRPSLHPDRVILSFGENPSSEASVTWRTDSSVKKAFAEIAPAAGAPKFWRNAKTIAALSETLDFSDIPDANNTASYHSVKFQNLEANTTYAYRVGDGEHWSEWFQFKTASTNPDEKFSFLYVGDAQNYILELWSRLIREGFRKAPDARFFIHAGDLINNAHHDRQWHEWFTAGGFIHSMVPTMSIPGNHEYGFKNESDRATGTRSLSVQWKPQFTLPENGPSGLEETAYFMDYQDTKFIFLDSNKDWEKQAQWLEEILQKNDKKWTIVSYHHPLFSASAGRDNEALRKIWKPIFDKYKVDLALQGHDHSYARGRVSPVENIMDGTNMRDKTGTVYVVSVSGGKMYGLDPNGWAGLGAERDRAAENTQLFQVITIEGNHLKFESYTAVGELYDAFELIKEKNGLNKFVEHKGELGPEYRFENSIPYEDQLPKELESQLIKSHPDFQIQRVNYVDKDGEIEFSVQLKNKEGQNKSLLLDRQGNVIEEK
ncbi:metallophosphoesterase family protein [Algoriphagus sp. CAU 1675]|uniref:purple acid phosphatase family protein n=1 Tax=Algoriphagus sp. CAU 1675 TaxID=3032597 RepID=UPI0023DB6CF2|nr:metallophosphoesterase family protein [Algoriphagus sp. CAU 1675]MDF2158308.1 metallophosphoesterase family protein [Algoriphagus sp. CAU 1675]